MFVVKSLQRHFLWLYLKYTLSGRIVNQMLAGAPVLAILIVHLPEQPISAADTLSETGLTPTLTVQEMSVKNTTLTRQEILH